jgi:hypothetical protein
MCSLNTSDVSGRKVTQVRESMRQPNLVFQIAGTTFGFERADELLDLPRPLFHGARLADSTGGPERPHLVE